MAGPSMHARRFVEPQISSSAQGPKKIEVPRNPQFQKEAWLVAARRGLKDAMFLIVDYDTQIAVTWTDDICNATFFHSSDEAQRYADAVSDADDGSLDTRLLHENILWIFEDHDKSKSNFGDSRVILSVDHIDIRLSRETDLMLRTRGERPV